MLFLYRIIINFIYLLSPIIIIVRLLKKKEHLTRFREKIGFFPKKKKMVNLNGFMKQE